MKFIFSYYCTHHYTLWDNIKLWGMDIYNKNLTERLAAKVNETQNSVIDDIRQCSMLSAPIAGHTNFTLHTLTDTSYTPIAQYKLLDNGENTILLDGTPRGWAEANSIEQPSLSITNTLEYAKQVVNTLWINNSKLQVVTSIEDIDFAQMPSPEKFETIHAAIKPPVVSFRSNSFTILTCLLEGDSLYDCIITINQGGEIEITDKNPLLTGIPIDELIWD